MHEVREVSDTVMVNKKTYRFCFRLFWLVGLKLPLRKLWEVIRLGGYEQGAEHQSQNCQQETPHSVHYQSLTTLESAVQADFFPCTIQPVRKAGMASIKQQGGGKCLSLSQGVPQGVCPQEWGVVGRQPTLFLMPVIYLHFWCVCYHCGLLSALAHPHGVERHWEGPAHAHPATHCFSVATVRVRWNNRPSGL